MRWPVVLRVARASLDRCGDLQPLACVEQLHHVRIIQRPQLPRVPVRARRRVCVRASVCAIVELCARERVRMHVRPRVRACGAYRHSTIDSNARALTCARPPARPCVCACARDARTVLCGGRAGLSDLGERERDDVVAAAAHNARKPAVATISPKRASFARDVRLVPARAACAPARPHARTHARTCGRTCGRERWHTRGRAA